MIRPLLIFALLFSQTPLFAQEGPVQTSEFVQKKRAFEACIDSRILIFEQAKESASDTVDAAFADCANERAEIYFAMREAREKAGTEFDHDWATRFLDDLIEKPKRDEALVLIFEIRSGIR